MSTIDIERTIAVLRELREASAACFRVIYRNKLPTLELEIELREAHVQNGFGVRAQKEIARLESYLAAKEKTP
jgi:hypothetical protein